MVHDETDCAQRGEKGCTSILTIICGNSTLDAALGTLQGSA